MLGICYGMQLACEELGGKVASAPAREYGRAQVSITSHADLFAGLPDETEVWMSHGDQVASVSDEFTPLARTATCPIAAVKHRSLPVYGLQFHPEVTHTPLGQSGAGQFPHRHLPLPRHLAARRFCRASDRGHSPPGWQRPGDLRTVGRCRFVGRGGAAVSGHRLAAQLHPGRQRPAPQGRREVGHSRVFASTFKTDLHVVKAEDKFLAALAGITDPQEKRRRIGHAFVDCFTDEAAKIAGAGFLAQGTLYPDVIESGAAADGPAATIKLHHNVGGLPEDLCFELIEPLRDLFKDEVRRLGLQLGLPEEIVWRHPFPGPGLAVRCWAK